ncbi:class I SAM-dependent methyltransferase [Dyadobacter arcticus]|uniref:tRNA (Cmo5U34)-methyltransferase n=1 Tax=Dyadobacter arcticus TaxID=1078754 RepID=A0ABX0UIT7_9BACT|nr:class I SAM-dependent methyltransferase [Dyadobacter arcticus]NIJ52827.1 tRNA (cmo5U34)-methyltransferase [Dyadobacter arcticus]
MKTVEIFEGPRAQTYDQSIRIWCPEYDSIQGLLPSLLGYHLGTSETKNVLVVGSGTGAEMVNLLQFTQAWKITGVDPSPEMVAQASEKLKSFPENQCKLITGTVDDLPLEENWDAALSILVFHFLPDDGSKLHLLKSIAQRLKKGALLVFVDIFGAGESFIYNLSLLKALLLSKGFESQLVEGGIEHIKKSLFPISQERLAELIKEAGFGKLHIFMQSLIFGGWIATKLD